MTSRSLPLLTPDGTVHEASIKVGSANLMINKTNVKVENANLTMNETNMRSRDLIKPTPLMCEGGLPDVDLSYWKNIPQDK